MYLLDRYPSTSTGCIFIPILFIHLNWSHVLIKGCPFSYRLLPRSFPPRSRSAPSALPVRMPRSQAALMPALGHYGGSWSPYPSSPFLRRLLVPSLHALHSWPLNPFTWPWSRPWPLCRIAPSCSYS